MQKRIEIIGFCLGWFAIVTQFILMLENRQVNIPETIIRFFSFFTILTNILVALFFTSRVFKLSIKQFAIFNKKGALTALTTFILIVGLVYQFVLRGIWEPKGIQRLVDELLHSIIPLYVLFYWIFFTTKEKIKFREVAIYLLYPIVYLLFVLVSGSFFNYYPYPFLNISEIGFENVLLNVSLILLLKLLILIILVSIKNRIIKNKTL